MIFIKYDKNAIQDLDNIYLTIAKDKKSAAIKFIDDIDKYILLLKINPELGMDCRKKGLNRDCRVLVYRSYMILYKIYKNHISIKRIINTKQHNKG